MNAATWPRQNISEERLLLVDPHRKTWAHSQVSDLAKHLSPGDLVVVNNAATLPASLHGQTLNGESVELRLMAQRGVTLNSGQWEVALFGKGDWHTPTELREQPPVLHKGDVITISQNFSATVVDVSKISPRLIELIFNVDGTQFWQELYKNGKPIQYSYLKAELPLSAVQTPFAARPWSVEMPSAGRPLTLRVLQSLRDKGVFICELSHAAGLSNTGDNAIDALLPFPERYEIPEDTVRKINDVRNKGNKILAIGTTVVRALEGNAFSNGGTLSAGSGVTDLKLNPNFKPTIVDGVLTGMHDPRESHYELMQAFAPLSLLQKAWEEAAEKNYLAHEFGDSCLIF